MPKPTSKTAGIALVDMMVGVAVGAMVLAGAAYFLSSGSLLVAKNLSINVSHTSLRTSIDNIIQSVDQANGEVSLIDGTGKVITDVSAEGVVFDKFVGGPFVVTHPGGEGLAATATTLTLTRSLDPKASPPIPQPGDVILLDGAMTVRLTVAAVTASPAIAGLQTISVNLQEPAGTVIPWASDTKKTADVVRRIAFLVVPKKIGDVIINNELRYFDRYTNIASASTLMTMDVGIDAAGATTNYGKPFSIVAVDKRNFLKVDMHIQDKTYAKRLAKKELNQFATTEQVELLLAPKNF